MSDRKLLEAAANACGFKINIAKQADRDAFAEGNTDALWINGVSTSWNPLLDDGQALRVAVQLGFLVAVFHRGPSAKAHTEVFVSGRVDVREDAGGDPFAATRRAVVRAAAEMGQQTKDDHARHTDAGAHP